MLNPLQIEQLIVKVKEQWVERMRAAQPDSEEEEIVYPKDVLPLIRLRVSCPEYSSRHDILTDPLIRLTHPTYPIWEIRIALAKNSKDVSQTQILSHTSEQRNLLLVSLLSDHIVLEA